MPKPIKIANMQLGKNKLTDNFIKTLESNFQTHENVKISVLKSCGRDRERIKQIAEEIVKKLGKRFTYKIVGFTIFVKKWRKRK